MTDISLEKVSYFGEKRAWLWGEHGVEPGCNPSIALDFANGGLTALATNGYVPSGVLLGRITASGKFGAYDPSASDGREKAAGVLFGMAKVPAKSTTVVGGALVVHAFIKPDKLPFQSGPGSLDDAAKSALPLIYWL